MDNKIIDKISKLLKLSHSPNEQEALSAFEKAHQLLKEYNLSIEDIKEKPELTKLDLEEQSKAYKWKTLLLCSVAKLNYCTIITEKRYRSTKQVIFGREANIISTKAMYEYLVEAVERLTKEYRKRNSYINMNSFKQGIVLRLQYRFSIMGQTEECTALVPITEEAESFAKSQYSNLKQVSTVVSDDYSTHLGQKAGDEISLNQQVEEDNIIQGALN